MTDTTTSTFKPGKGAGATVGVAVLGMGTVGTEVLRLLEERKDEFAARIGGNLEVRGIAVSDLSKPRPGVSKDLLTDDALSLVKREDIDLVVEVIGGIDYPRQVVLAALRAGKAVVTANKALIAAHSEELSEAAEAQGVDLFFEAAVAAAIPVVGPLRRSLAGDKVDTVIGVVNGTTNFILDAMYSRGASYEEMLAEATALGYAEADPSADVDGYDAASKAAILASLAFHTRVTADDVHTEGIRTITVEDIEAAKAANSTIKLLAICERLVDEQGQESVSARVYPALVPTSHPLASVNESYNAVFVEAESAGRLMFYGNGAGGAPTASAVLGDVVAVSRNIVHGGRGPGESTYARLPIADFGDVLTRYHVDMHVDDKVGVLAEVSNVFSEQGVSIRAVRQEGLEEGARLVVITHHAKEADLEATVERFKQLESVKAVRSVIRMEG
ncbi:homoserine dehydrogenase [Corynebacterium sp. 320]|uniref:Homoserine dehydrogenase n=1 Tax=Corynebacterium zhongnanshanii TaxID=2768834 RepID=A0ABQ6VFK3_9CORY|nr:MULTISPECIES: homoserine dehydrogenase [Corynebacterium]KAB1503948.1 homoserine dehydrogenase [Corynebacterium sp. 320]KAB1552953.1 homoserine dehydrogenase [Corynebacterium sp. 321]KAB1553827.1 homoserine dehydrogenase [Corynebacterium sp. 319]KAB3523202.1 homoserine dehydrogenase [Corynebacterium zhongnanshanii]KAB3528084.1 homoserine dehydrogenase [Corynebacterium sp. 250]